AGAVRSDEAEERAARHDEVEIVDGLLRAEALVDAVEHDRGVGERGCGSGHASYLEERVGDAAPRSSPAANFSLWSTANFSFDLCTLRLLRPNRPPARADRGRGPATGWCSVGTVAHF